MDSADVFCLLDNVQSSHNSFENRQRVKTHDGPTWLTVPVRRGIDVLIKDVLVVRDQPWQRKHWRTIEIAYKKAPHFERYAEEIRTVITSERLTIAELGHATLCYFADVFGIKTRVVKASDYELIGTKSDLIVVLSKKLGGTHFIFGKNGRDYADVESFKSAGVRVSFQEYRSPRYPQLHGAFVPDMGCLDLLFNVGGEAGLAVIRSGQTLVTEPRR